MAEVNQYRIYCIDEGEFVTGWGTTAPTTCYTNTAHEVNPNSVSKIYTITENKVTIDNTQTITGFPPVGGYYRCSSLVIPCAASTITSYEVVHQIPVCINSLQINIDASNVGDYVSIITMPNTVIGLLESAVDVGATVIPVNPVSLAYVKVGYFMKLKEGGTLNELGIVISINNEDSTVTIETPTTDSFNAGTGQILLERRIMSGFYMSVMGSYVFGKYKIGSSYVPANTQISIDYTNNTASPKTFVLHYEFYY